ncbi:DUF4835 family protein [Hymenobacter setariae]|uniref:DUF4835 family protein n=1 Tax=Hymenobacter setariae TaxID=2594794 RepID=A0A558C1H9_9BACT|nr:DUF4835 family protein [Hymenobacter setariae]TVT42638.1 DUF4835 family protein [Hymenobacter setariae]
MRNVFTVLALLLGLLAACPVQAQELNADVQVSLQNVTITDATLVNQMQAEMRRILNETPWTRLTYGPNERINLRMFVGITAIPQNGTYVATMRLIATRPVYGTGYETNVLSLNDRNFIFNFSPAAPISFIPGSNTFTSNLASLLGFYAYLVIGTDQDTFARLGGSPYYDQARLIMQYSAGQTTTTGETDTGWTDSSPTNRYWLLNNLTDPQLEPFRTSLYAYYRQGMDMFIEKPGDARTSIMEALSAIQKANVIRPGTLFVRAFFNAKADEITNIFRTGTPEQKQQLVTMLSDADPDNLAKYQTLLRP